MNHDHFRIQVQSLYKIVEELESMFPGRPFTPDGHMVGSLGECLVANAYNLKLMAPSNKGFDAITKDGKRVEIKATQSNGVAFRSCPEYAIIIKIHKDGTFKEYYNGPGEIIWNIIKGQKVPPNGQRRIPLNKVRTLNESVNENDRIQKNT